MKRRRRKGRKRVITKLLPYQREGVKKVHEDFDGRALIADSQGLGKSIQAISYCQWHLPRDARVLVICPANLKWNWQYEWKTHARERTEILETLRPAGKDPKSKTRPRVLIVNYDILSPQRGQPGWVNWLVKWKPHAVVIDESEKMKEAKAKWTRAIFSLCRRAAVPKILCLTGTPLEKPIELWTTVNLIRPDIWNDLRSFQFRHCGPRKVPWGPGWTFDGACHLGELHDKLRSHVMVRRTKEEVLKDLPPKLIQTAVVDIADRDQYEEAEREFIKWLARTRGAGKARRAQAAERLVRVGYLKRLAARLKFWEVKNWIDKFFEETGEKLLVFGIHRGMVRGLAKRYPGCAILDGLVSGRDRQTAVDRWNTDRRCRLIVANMDAAGRGWSGRGGSTVLYAEMGWTSRVHAQGLDRLHGINRGVKGRRTRGVFLVAGKTVEERLCKIIQAKSEVAGRVLDGSRESIKIDVMDQLERSYLKDQ